MKVPNAFVYIALVAPMLVAASRIEKGYSPYESESGVRGIKTDQRKLVYEHLVYEPEPKKGKSTKGHPPSYYPPSHEDDEVYPSDDEAYPPEDEMYYHDSGKGTKSAKGGEGGKGGGKGTKSGGGSKGGKGTKSGGGSKGSSGGGSGGCDKYKVEVQAIQKPSQANAPAGGDINAIGHIFSYNSPLYEDPELTTPVGGLDDPSGFVTGFCVRFQATSQVGGNQTVAGAGTCIWTYTISLDNLEGTFDVTDEVFDSVLSTLAVTGGTGAFVGVSGEAEYVPVYAAGAPTNQQDVFTQALYYNMTATLQVENCHYYYDY